MATTQSEASGPDSQQPSTIQVLQKEEDPFLLLIGNPANLVQQFTYFRKLPIELRLKIWSASLPGQRVVPVECRHNDTENGDPTYFITTARPPVALLVCRESRATALKKYTSRLRTTSQSIEIRLDPINDCVYMPWTGRENVYIHIADWAASDLDDALKLIQHFAIDDRMFERYTAPDIANCLLSLQTLYWVFHDIGCRSSGTYDNWESYTDVEKFEETELKHLEDARNDSVWNADFERCQDFLESREISELNKVGWKMPTLSPVISPSCCFASLAGERQAGAT